MNRHNILRFALITPLVAIVGARAREFWVKLTWWTGFKAALYIIASLTAALIFIQSVGLWDEFIALFKWGK